MLKLTIKDLLVVQAVSETANLKATAQFLNITQSALTHRIQKVEQQLGIPLYSRFRGRVSLTHAGKILLETAHLCIREMDKAERILSENKLGHSTTVNFGGSTLSGLEWFPDFLKLLSVDDPDIDLEIALDSALDPIDALRSRNIDLALLPLNAHSNQFESKFLFNDEMVALMASSHAKAGNKFLEASDFLEESYIGFRPGRERGREYERFFSPAGITPKRLIPGRSIETIIALVRAGIGITIATRWSIKHYLAMYDLTALPLTKSGLMVPWHAVIRKDEAGAAPAGRVADRMASFFKPQNKVELSKNKKPIKSN